jgi:Rrf2 family nitric oxide-sensitive transcriptional repressor
MRLTAHTDFGLRVLMTLAVVDERVVTIEELARRHRLSRNHLMKVAQTLVRVGIVESVRGRAGGLRLARPAHSIRIGDAVRALEDDTGLVECLGRKAPNCALAGMCILTKTMSDALEAFFADLNRSTLADLAASRARLRERLGVPAPAVKGEAFA